MARPALVRIVFGGTFDPPTLAHRMVVECALASIQNAELIVVPAAVSPHKEGSTKTAASHRLAMARLAFDGLPRVRVSDEELVRGGTSFTVDTLQAHRDALGPDARLYFLVGADALLSFGRWREPERILSLAKILSVARPGFDLGQLDHADGLSDVMRARLRAGFLTCDALDISSTQLRQLIADGERPSTNHVDASVARYIEEHGLYRDSDAT